MALCPQNISLGESGEIVWITNRPMPLIGYHRNSSIFPDMIMG